MDNFGGWVKVSTHSRLKAAVMSDLDKVLDKIVSTHSRLKAAADGQQNRRYRRQFQHTAA